MTINPLDEMKKCINCLEDSTQPRELHLESIQTLIDWCEDINLASGNSFYSIFRSKNRKF
jgi:hypothetical protein